MRHAMARTAAAACCVVLAGLTAGGCNGLATSSTMPSDGSVPPTPAASPSPPHGVFGAECSMIPSFGPGSLRSIGSKPMLAALATNPQFSVFTAAIRSAGLARTLNRRHGYTLVIPANPAFAALSSAQVARLRDHRDLARIVRYYTVDGRITPGQFARSGSVGTAEGGRLALSAAGRRYQVNGAPVLCGNIPVANASLYIVGKVLLPPRAG